MTKLEACMSLQLVQGCHSNIDLVNANVPAGNVNNGETAVCVHAGPPPVDAGATAMNNFSTKTEIPALLAHDKAPSTNAGLSTTKRNLREPANPELRDESYEFALNLSNSVLTELDMDNVSMDCSLCDSTFDYLIELINHKSTVHDPMLMPGINAQSTLHVSDNIGDIHGGDMPASKGKGCKKTPAC